MDMEWQVNSEGFQGPLDLLLTLIESRKLYINDLSLASVTDDYIAYVSTLGSFPLAQTAQFVVIASTLLLIKSRSLLPDLDLTPEEEEAVGDLTARLKVYKVIRDASKALGARWLQQPPFEPQRVQLPQLPFSPGADLTQPKMHAAVHALVATLPTSIFRAEARIERLPTLEDVITRVAERVQRSLTRMSEFSRGAKRGEVILFFLAILELTKNNQIDVEQSGRFEDIVIRPQGGVSTPRFT